MNDDASRIDRSEIKNTGSNRLTNTASSFFAFAPTLSLYFRIHCRSRSVNIINSISSDFSFVYHKTFCFFALGLQIDRIRYTYIYIKLISRNDYRISTRVRIHVYFKFTQTLALGCRNCRLSLPSNHNLRYISYSYNYKHRRASTLDGSIAPSFHRGFNRGNVCASSAPTAGQPARFDPFNLNGAKLAADRSIPLSSLPLSTLPIPLFSRSKIRERSAWRGEAWRTKACVPHAT